MVWGVALSLSAALANALLAGVQADECAYVTNPDGRSISIVNTRAQRLVARVAVPSFAQQLALAPEGARLYAGGTMLAVIDTTAREVITTIAVDGTRLVAVSPDGTRVYVASPIQVIDAATYSIVATVPVQPSGGFAFSPDGSRLYVTVAGGVAVIDVAGNVILSRIGVDHASHGIAITPDGAFAYVTAVQLWLVDLSTTAVSAIGAPGPGLNGELAISPDGSLLYVAGFRFGPTDRVTVVSTATNTVTATIPVPLAAATDIAVTHDGAFTYRSSGNQVSIIDNASQTVVTNIDLPPCASNCVGTGKLAIGMVPDGCPLTLLPPMPTPTTAPPTPTPTPAATPPPTTTQSAPPLACTGDCNHDGFVTVDELLVAVNIALGARPVTDCPAVDCHHSTCAPPAARGMVTVDCLVRAVGHALSQCPTAGCTTQQDCNDENPCTFKFCSSAGCTWGCDCHACNAACQLPIRILSWRAAHPPKACGFKTKPTALGHSRHAEKRAVAEYVQPELPPADVQMPDDNACFEDNAMLRTRLL